MKITKNQVESYNNSLYDQSFKRCFEENEMKYFYMDLEFYIDLEKETNLTCNYVTIFNLKRCLMKEIDQGKKDLDRERTCDCNNYGCEECEEFNYLEFDLEYKEIFYIDLLNFQKKELYPYIQKRKLRQALPKAQNSNIKRGRL